MSREQNMAVFRRVIEEGINQEKYSILPELFDPNYIENQFGLHPTIEGMIRDMQYLHKAFPDFSMKIAELIADENTVWGRMIMRGTNDGGFMGPPNGKQVEITVFDVLRFENGKAVEHWGVPDRFAVLQQLGLLPAKQAQPS